MADQQDESGMVPGDTSPGWFPWIVARLKGARAMQIAGPIILVPALLFVLLLVYIGTAGLPEGVTHRLEKNMEQEGFITSFEKIRFNIFTGIIADKVKFYETTKKEKVVLRADRVRLDTDPLQWFRGKPGVEELILEEGYFLLYEPPAYTKAEPLILDHVYSTVTLEPGGLRLRRMQASLLGMEVSARGYMVKGSGDQKWNGDRIRAPLNQLEKLAPGWYPKLLHQLSAIRFSLPPKLEMDFMIHPDQPGFSEVTVKGKGGETRVRGARFDHWQLDAAFKENLLTVNRLMVSSADKSTLGKGRINLAAKTASGSLYSDLPIAYWSSLVPSSWYDLLESEGFLFEGPLAWEVVFPESPFDALGVNVSGWVGLKNAEIKGIWIEEGSLAYERSEDGFELKNIDAIAGKDAERGKVLGSFKYDVNTKKYGGHLKTDTSPLAFLDVIGRGPQWVARRFKAEQGWVGVDVEYGGRSEGSNTFYFVGDMAGTNFLYNGVFAKSFNADCVYTNSTLTFNNLHIVRDEGASGGRLKLDFDNELVEINLEGEMNPKALGRLVGPGLERALRFLRVEGSCRMKADGIFDYNTNGLTDLDVQVDAEQLGTDWFLSDTCGFDLAFKGPSLIITNMEGTYARGTYNGYARLEGLMVSTSMDVHVQGNYTNINLRYVVQQVRQHDRDPFKGQLSGAIELFGQTGEESSGTYTGTGQVVVMDGRLFEFPLFGGLSRLLGKISPGLGTVAQTDFKSSFRIKNKKFHSQDILLEGDVIRLNAKGRFGFDGDLDFDVKVKPLREGPIGKVVEIITKPLTALLLDFHLKGSVKEPEWRPENMPKELYLIND